MSASHRVFVAALVLASAACSKSSQESAPAPAANTPNAPVAQTANTPATPTGGGPAQTAPKGPPGTIEGVVKFTGKVPPAKTIDKVTDPVCAAAKPKEETISVGKNQGLKDVLVRIENGGAQGEAPSTAPQLKQEGCEYVPHVLGVVAGEEIEILNADKTMHNVHTYKGQETILNAGQPSGASPIKKVASDETGTLKVKCDVHPWMTAFIVVTDHPYFAVTDADGHFKIPNVPAGTYRLEAWHPELGTLEKKDVVVAPNGTIDPAFGFTGDEKKPE